MKLLIFTIFILLISVVMLQSNPKQPANRWCFAAGCIFTVGAFKEYLYSELGVILIEYGWLTQQRLGQIYYGMTMVQCCFAMPTMMMFCLYFCEVDKKHPRLFRVLCILNYLSAVLILPTYWKNDFSEFNVANACSLESAFYNVIYCVMQSVLLIRKIVKERKNAEFRQKTVWAVCVMVMTDFWIITGFPYQKLGIASSDDLWMQNELMIAAVVIFLLIRMCHGGIFGLQLRLERNDQQENAKNLRKNTWYINHALKNELSKIEWSLQILERKGVSKEDLSIIRNSTEHLKNFVHETKLYSDQITLSESLCSVQELFAEAQEDLKKRDSKIPEIQIRACDEQQLYCDRVHIQEVLKNLLLNAAEAVGSRGTVELSYQIKKSGKSCISVKDNGRGMSEEDIRYIFKPYYTTKHTERNMGLGLYYCWNVMNAHGGRIEVKSKEGIGSEFILCFPAAKCRKKGLKKRSKGNAVNKDN